MNPPRDILQPCMLHLNLDKNTDISGNVNKMLLKLLWKCIFSRFRFKAISPDLVPDWLECR